jgi:hypothetical protein
MRSCWFTRRAKRRSLASQEPARRSRYRLFLEDLEERQLLATYLVTNSTDSGAGSLRQGILDANASPGLDTIAFNIGGPGVQTIRPLSALPTITGPVVIDGTTQPGFAGTPLIELAGNSAGSANGLMITAGNSTVRGLVINRFAQSGIVLRTSGGNVLEGNYIGTDATGTLDLGNGVHGVAIENAANNRVGGTNPASRNLVSGNGHAGVILFSGGATGNLVQGNYVGTDVSGTRDLGNTVDGIAALDAPNNLIGGTAAGARNVVSGNDQHGIILLFRGASGNTVQGNYVGTDVTGTFDLGNTGVGVSIVDGSNNLVGGAVAGARNLISGNNAHGIEVVAATATGNRIEGNFIGTDVTGTRDLGNTVHGIQFRTGTASNLIGGTAPGAGNVIAGNDSNGITLTSDSGGGHLIQGNYIGTNAAGTADLGNRFNGVFLNSVPNNVVGGPATGARNVISGNDANGVRLTGVRATGNIVAGNYIGTNAAGAAALPNPNGVQIDEGASNNRIGTNGDGVTDAAERNVIAGNGGHGVLLRTAGTSQNVVAGNGIGLNAAGTAALPNGSGGIRIDSGAANNRIGTYGDWVAAAVEGNTIASNSGPAVLVADSTSTGNSIRGNAIYANSGLGIDLGANGVTANDTGDADTGPNNSQNFPTVVAAVSAARTAIVGTMNSLPNTTFTLDFYTSPSADASGFGEGQRYLGSTTVTTNASGNGAFAVQLAETAPDEMLTATATDPAGNTSELSAAIRIRGPQGGASFTPIELPQPGDAVMAAVAAVFSELIGAARSASGPTFLLSGFAETLTGLLESGSGAGTTTYFSRPSAAPSGSTASALPDNAADAADLAENSSLGSRVRCRIARQPGTSGIGSLWLDEVEQADGVSELAARPPNA